MQFKLQYIKVQLGTTELTVGTHSTLSSM